MTARRGTRIPQGAWPRLLSQARAADYCDVSPTFFRSCCDVPPIELGGRRLWDRHRLDDWIDRLQEDGAASGSDPIMEALGNDRGAR
jgi:hypothetical protein